MATLAPGLSGEFPSIAMAMLLRAKHEWARPAFCHSPAHSAAMESGDAEHWFTWGHIAQWVFEACVAIEKRDPKRGSHLATIQPNSVEWFVLDFACQILGLVHVSIDHRWPDIMVGRLIEQSDARLLFSQSFSPPVKMQSSMLAWSVNWRGSAIDNFDLEQLIERGQSVSPHLPAQILFTSGTSDEPKAVMLSNRNLVSNAIAKLDAAPQLESDFRLNILPFCHAYARTCELSTWVLSNSQLAIANDWNDFLRQASRLRPSLVNLVPYLVEKLFHCPQPKPANKETQRRLTPQEVADRLGGRVRLLQVGGAALPDSLWYELEKCGLPPLQGYGLTEASPVVCSNRAGQQQPGTIGCAVAGVSLRQDSLGQLWVRGENIMCGYYGDVKATQTRIQAGWLATGDLVDVDERGHYRVLGRISEVIVLSNGFKVSPELIEARLKNLAWIERVLIAGENRPFIVALVWPAQGRTPIHTCDSDSRDNQSLRLKRVQNRLVSDVSEHLRDLPAFMHPRKIIILAEAFDTDAVTNLVNSKGALRRKLALAHFQSQIDYAYSEPTLQ